MAAGTVDRSGGVAQSGRAPAWHAGGSWVRAPSPPPFFSSLSATWRRVGFTLGGFVAGEGSFIATPKQPAFKDGSPRLRFVFSVTIATRDRPILEALSAFLGFGSIRDMPPAREGYEPESEYRVTSFLAHHAATIPFSEQFLLPSAKRDQYEEWREAMEAQERAHPNRYRKGPSACSVPGCDKPVRGRMLCRSHYYRAACY
jgi:hypothetical protein